MLSETERSRALARVLSETERSDWWEGKDDWVRLLLSSLSRNRAERVETSGGTAGVERVDLRVGLVSCESSKSFCRAGGSVAGAILDRIGYPTSPEVIYTPINLEESTEK